MNSSIPTPSSSPLSDSFGSESTVTPSTIPSLQLLLNNNESINHHTDKNSFKKISISSIINSDISDFDNDLPKENIITSSSIEYNEAFKNLEEDKERFFFQDLSYENLDSNAITSESFNYYSIHGTLERLERSIKVLTDPNSKVPSIEYLHFLFFNVFILNKGILFKVGWSTDESKVYICTDCEKKLVTCKLIFDKNHKGKLENIERRFEEGCFDHVCELNDIQTRYHKVRLGKYKHERNKLLKKLHIDPNVQIAMKELDISYNRKVKENEELFRFFKKNNLSLYDFKLNEVIGDDRRLNFFLHIISFVKVLFEKYHNQLNLKKNESASNIARILTHLTIHLRLKLTTQSLERYCTLVGSDPKTVYERLATKLCNRIERYLKVKTAPVTDNDRATVLEIMGLISNIDLNS